MSKEITTVILEWEQTNLSKLHLHQEAYFYAFSRANTVVYIGKSEWTTLKSEIAQNLKRLNISNSGLSLWIGHINRHKTTIKRITTEIIDDVESVLIFKVPSTHNIKKTKTYRGRLNLKIINENITVFPKQISITSKTKIVKT